MLSFNKYQKKEIKQKTYRSSAEIISSISELEVEFKTIMLEIEEMLK